MPWHSSFFPWTTYRKSQKCDEDNPERRNFCMLKKAVPVVAMCSVLLVGCNTNDAVPNNNETPMEEVRDGVDNIVPEPGVNTPSPTEEKGLYDNNDRINGDVNNGVNDVNPNVNNGTVPNANNDLVTPNANETIQQPNTVDEDIKVKEDINK